MAAPTVTQLRTALAANLAPIGAATGCTISAEMLTNPTPPTIHLYPQEIDYNLAMQAGLDRYVFRVQAFVAVTLDIDAQVNLDAFLARTGSVSVKQALESDRTLGGLSADVSVISSEGYRVYQPEGRPSVIGTGWRVDVLAVGK